MKRYAYQIAGFGFSVDLPEEVSAERVLPSFGPFRMPEGGNGEELFRLSVCASLPETEEPVEELESSTDDLGHTRLYRTGTGYRVDLSYCTGGAVHRMVTDREFRTARVRMVWNDRYVPQVLTSLLRIVYAQAILKHRAVSVHAAVVEAGGEGVLFWGRSGTGKSTHAARWCATFPDCALLNDDNPTLRLEEDGVWVYGTPWSGKTPCYRNRRFPVRGMVRLYQAPANRFVRVEGIPAFATLLPGCAVVRQDRMLYNHLCDTLVTLVERIRIGILYCRPDREAAELCRRELYDL